MMTKTEKKSFDQILAELEKLVKDLDTEKVNLEEGLEIFEKGVVLYKDCQERLKTYEKKIAMLNDQLNEEAVE